MEGFRVLWGSLVRALPRICRTMLALRHWMFSGGSRRSETRNSCGQVGVHGVRIPCSGAVSKSGGSGVIFLGRSWDVPLGGSRSPGLHKEPLQCAATCDGSGRTPVDAAK